MGGLHDRLDPGPGHPPHQVRGGQPAVLDGMPDPGAEPGLDLLDRVDDQGDGVGGLGVRAGGQAGQVRARR